MKLQLAKCGKLSELKEKLAEFASAKAKIQQGKQKSRKESKKTTSSSVTSETTTSEPRYPYT